MGLYREQGIVLRTYKLGEADRIVVLLTRGRGKVRAVAKGVRKTKSRFGSRTEPTSHITIQLYEGRQLDTITQVETIDHFRAIRDDYDRYTRASAMLEAVDQLAQEHEVDAGLYTLLLRGLRALEADDSPVIVGAFFLKLLALSGLSPVLDACASCGEPDDLVAFDLDAGGVLCRSCRQGVPLSAEALELLRLVLGGGLNEALRQPASPATREVDRLAVSAMEHHLERGLRAVPIIDS